MSANIRVPFISFCAAALLLAPANLGRAADPKAASPAPAAEQHGQDARPATPARKVKQLTAEMIERRDRVRRLLAALRKQPFNAQQNTCGNVLDFCRAFGCETELTDAAGQKINGITCLCWNMPCGGYELMTISEGHLAPRVGYGYQSGPSELAAVLALSHVPADYPARAGKTVRTVADLIEYEKLSCRPGLDMSLKLVALAYYVQGPSWKDSLGGEWTLQRVVAEELDRPTGAAPRAPCTHGRRPTGCWDSARPWSGSRATRSRWRATWPARNTTSNESIGYAYSAQNSDGSWGRPTGRDYAMAVAYTAHMLEWLVTALPASRLEEPQITRGIDFLHTTFNSTHYQTYISTMSPREISAAMHAAYVLNVYDRRVFAPADPPPSEEPAKAEKTEQKSAGRAGQAR